MSMSPRIPLLARPMPTTLPEIMPTRPLEQHLRAECPLLELHQVVQQHQLQPRSPQPTHHQLVEKMQTVHKVSLCTLH